ncbi:MAG: ribosome silencing factor [Clostridia bacterium]|nr:ribosome silencing factor [Clostridia bacterium]
MENNNVSNFEGLGKAKEAVRLLLAKKACDIRLYDVRESSGICDYYVNCTGRSMTHVASLSDELVEHFEALDIHAMRIEGKRGNSWILVDFGDLIVNIFDEQARGYYNHDRLMAAECLIDISDIVREIDEKFSV